MRAPVKPYMRLMRRIFGLRQRGRAGHGTAGRHETFRHGSCRLQYRVPKTAIAIEQHETAQHHPKNEALELAGLFKLELHREEVHPGADDGHPPRERSLQRGGHAHFLFVFGASHVALYLRDTRTPMRRPTPKATPRDS